MPVNIQNQGIQNAHSPESVLSADSGEKLQKLRNGSFHTAENSAGFGKTHALTGEQRTFADQLPMMECQVIGHRIRDKLCRKLRGQVFRQRLDLIVCASAFVQINAAILPNSALGIIAVCAELR